MLKLKLKPEDDRVINMLIEDQYGEKYRINIEMLNHHFKEDEVQVSVTKRKGSDSFKTANAIVVNEEEVAVKEKSPTNSVWFEFHRVGNLPRVKSE